MKIFKTAIMALAMAATAFGFSGCAEADPEFVHTNNFISAMVAMKGRTNSDKQFEATVYEFDKNGEMLPKFDATKIEEIPDEAWGGSGVIVFTISQEDREDIDLTDVYLRATVTYDAFIYPTLSGKHNILVTEENPNGLVIAVKSGVNKVRKYRIMGYYE